MTDRATGRRVSSLGEALGRAYVGGSGEWIHQGSGWWFGGGLEHLPSGNLTKSIKKLLKMTIYSGFSHEKW